jgi:hypothetical protein
MDRKMTISVKKLENEEFQKLNFNKYKNKGKQFVAQTSKVSTIKG